MTKEKFHAFVKVQYSGICNMLDVNTIIRASGYKLDRDDHLDIITNYDKYLTEFGDIDREDLTVD
jgi:hypothetical protein